MARKTQHLNLYLPDENEFYNVEKDQNENFEKIDTKIKEIEEGKEPAFTKNTGFNLNKSDSIDLDDSNMLATSKAAKKLNDLISSLDICPYKAGDIYITTNTQNPALIWQGTTWQKIEGKFLKASANG